MILLMTTAFVSLLFACQWTFSQFLISPAADNAFFGGSRYWPYFSPPAGEWQNRFHAKGGPVNATALTVTFIIALVSTTCGLIWGNWMAKVKR